MTRRVVFDCMVFLQGAANPEGPAAACLRLAEQGHVELCISSEFLSEVRDVLTRPKIQHRFSALTEETVSAFLTRVRRFALVVSDVPRVASLPRDPKDEKYLDLAVAVGAECLVIDLVARTRGTGEFHAIQCKFYAEDHRIQKSDIDSFFTASGQKPFTHRIIVTTTNEWTEHSEAALFNQQPPVTRIDLLDLETSQIDWSKYQPDAAPILKPKFEPRPHQQKAIKNVLLGLQNEPRGKADHGLRHWQALHKEAHGRRRCGSDLPL